VDYIGPTLDALAAQMESNPLDPMFGQFAVLVLNNHVPVRDHVAFYAAKEKHADNSALIFMDNDHALQDANPDMRDEYVCAFVAFM